MCKFTNNCSFFQEFANRESFIWKAMIKSYCNDGGECKRHQEYEVEGQKDIPAEFLPSGSYASKAFLSLL